MADSLASPSPAPSARATVPLGVLAVAWFADAIGIFLAAPVVFACIDSWSDRQASAGSRRVLELAGLAAAAILLTEGVFGEWLPIPMRTPAFTLPLLLWAVFRFGPGGLASLMLFISVAGFWHTTHGQGPLALAEVSRAVWVLRSQGTAAMASLSLLLLSSVIAERKQASQERALLVTDLQQALAEVKSLQGMIPICAWCHKVRDDAGFWQRIETYLQARTDATFSHGICPACTRMHELDGSPVAAFTAAAPDRPRPHDGA